MVNVTINHREISVPEGTTIMEAAASIHIQIPKLCYLKDVNEISACRICVVEVEGQSRLVTSCNNVVEEGMVIYTNSPRVRRNRRHTIEMLLSQHNMECPMCVRSGNCSLQSIANDLNVVGSFYKQELVLQEWDMHFPLIREANKCIKCMRCIQICDKVQGMNVWDVSGTGSRTTVGVSGCRDITSADCTLCGQCVTHCPTGALRERDDTTSFYRALEREDTVVVAQIAPAVRAAWGESLGLSREEAAVGKIADALRRMGVDYVFDTSFSADLTIMEEAHEFVEKFTKGELEEDTMFTSCCPGWVSFMKTQYPQMTGCLSTAKSPQQMFGAVMKSAFAKKLGIEPERIYAVSIMPCLAKKAEREMTLFYEEFAGHDVDCVLTTRELDRMLKADYIDPHTLEDVEFDRPFGESSGAGVIFGATGGVMEAALRSAYFMVTGENPPADAFKEIRGVKQKGWTEAEFDIAGKKVSIAVVSGLKNTRMLMEAIRKKKVHYHFVEVMACPGGCSGGGGQPIHDGYELAGERGENLYFLDKNAKIRFSHENPDIRTLYQEYMGEPGGKRAHQLLHTEHRI
ncbi:[FeFe] hydrogenase, group A [Anaerostipes butyraticus]|uniref:Hydrogenase n=1 Tax=Anaerostipes butyraticus TaxID=645466 RepID=A0A916Q8F7_9FIRM|nr:[FeFe] hydrogenase, group A [Anaerostipes butyraticus]GFO86232.1 hydrogenase [Anaerostipes butyraticus]HJC81925.1 [FeFe] hydrogenase, group A [Candidatus Anaerostipes avicola]